MPEPTPSDSARRALDTFAGRPIEPADLGARLTEFLAEFQDLARHMRVQFRLVLGRGYLIQTLGQRRDSDWPSTQRPLTELAAAPQAAAARALNAFLADGTIPVPDGFAAAAAELLAALVDLADRSGVDFERCLMATSHDPAD